MSLDSVANFVSCPKILQANRGLPLRVSQNLLERNMPFKTEEIDSYLPFNKTCKFRTAHCQSKVQHKDTENRCVPHDATFKQAITNSTCSTCLRLVCVLASLVLCVVQEPPHLALLRTKEP